MGAVETAVSRISPDLCLRAINKRAAILQDRLPYGRVVAPDRWFAAIANQRAVPEFFDQVGERPAGPQQRGRLISQTATSSPLRPNPHCHGSSGRLSWFAWLS